MKIKAAAFESGQRLQHGRGFIYMPLEPEKELTAGTRLEIIRRARWLYNNVGFAARAIDGPVRYAIGGGIAPQARTQNRDWNAEAEQHFHDTVGTTPFAFDLAGAFDFYEAQSIISKQVALDGDVFLQLTLSEAGSAMVRMISAERVGSGNGVTDSRWHDGVLISPRTGRPTHYRFLADVQGKNWTDVRADDVIHIPGNRRIGFARGVSDLARAAGHLHDTAEILSFTKSSFKLASQIAFVLEANSDLRLGPTYPGVDDTAAETAADKPLKVDDIMQGSMVPNLRPGESIKPISNPHPGSSFEPFMNYLARDISWGVGCSPEILWAVAGATGAGYRLALADAQTFFEERQRRIINHFCRRFWKFWAWHEIESGRLPYPGDDWYRVDWITPRKATVDFGRDTKTLLEIVKSGGMSQRQFAEMHGWDLESIDDAIITDYQRRKKMVEEAGLTMSEVFGADASPPPIMEVPK